MSHMSVCLLSMLLCMGYGISVPISSVVCATPQDNAECVPYIDKYWILIFNTTTPLLTAKNRQPVSSKAFLHTFSKTKSFQGKRHWPYGICCLRPAIT